MLNFARPVSMPALTQFVLLAVEESSTAEISISFLRLYVFVLAGFVGFQIITKVPALLHTPLMSATNAISGISLVGFDRGGRGPVQQVQHVSGLSGRDRGHDQRRGRLHDHRPHAEDVQAPRAAVAPQKRPMHRLSNSCRCSAAVAKKAHVPQVATGARPGPRVHHPGLLPGGQRAVHSRPARADAAGQGPPRHAAGRHRHAAWPWSARCSTFKSSRYVWIMLRADDRLGHRRGDFDLDADDRHAAADRHLARLRRAGGHAGRHFALRLPHPHPRTAGRSASRWRPWASKCCSAR